MASSLLNWIWSEEQSLSIGGVIYSLLRREQLRTLPTVPQEHSHSSFSWSSSSEVSFVSIRILCLQLQQCKQKTKCKQTRRVAPQARGAYARLLWPPEGQAQEEPRAPSPGSPSPLLCRRCPSLFTTRDKCTSPFSVPSPDVPGKGSLGPHWVRCCTPEHHHQKRVGLCDRHLWKNHQPPGKNHHPPSVAAPLATTWMEHRETHFLEEKQPLFRTQKLMDVYRTVWERSSIFTSFYDIHSEQFPPLMGKHPLFYYASLFK